MSDKKRLFENFLSLATLQGLNYILPLLTLPYLVRVLGPENYGLVAFAQSFVQFFVIFVDYGFNLSATNQIAVYRENREKVQRIFSTVITIKVFFTVISFVVLCLLVFLLPKFAEHKSIYVITFGMVVGNVLFPVWFFQGMERMRYITFLNIIAKALFTAGIFLLVKQRDDFLLVPLLNSLGIISIGIISLGMIKKTFSINIVLPAWNDIKYQLKEGWYVFISTVAISLYTVSNTFILGLFTNNTIVGYYAGAEKIISAANGMISPVSQALYPYISRLILGNREKGLMLIRKIVLIIGGGTLIVSFIIFFLAENIVDIALGDHYKHSIVVLKILSFLPFIIGLSNILGIQTMLTLGYKKAFSNILILASILNIFLAVLLVPNFHHVGTAVGVFISELFVTSAMFVYLYSKGIKLLEGKHV
ncbi:PST family polysaccharide transporter [Anoxybacillus tengchongensis]|uniref:PST family polysaccharide transporter n=1 Tax=Anoxybacillus tengchongensis TaxID=576944 RepID=A0A7X0D8V8_9BACL|nr:flippase [Anoxybacillus tengchongensis]MBB6176102.1 PST family polysaccharide transporter [Anoxybacillus tengchongensis]